MLNKTNARKGRIRMSETENKVVEEQLTMADFEEEINRSFHRMREGDIVNCTVIDIKEDGVLVDIGSYAEGKISIGELSDDPHFSMYGNIEKGQQFKCTVLEVDNGEGYVILSKKQAYSEEAWKSLIDAMEQEKVFTVTVDSVVNAGVIAYVDGIRGFIPASQLSISYVENLEDWVMKKLEVQAITVEPEKKKLVLSAKVVEKKNAEMAHQQKLSSLQKGIITTGTVEKIAPYGAFVTIGEGVTGLVHISRICGKHIKSPNEVLKLGDEVKVKIIDVVDGKISLDMKSVEDIAAVVEDIEEVPIEYSSEGTASTSLGSLLGKIKL